MEKTENIGSFCFYLGMLPVTSNQKNLRRLLADLGRVIRIRVAKENSSYDCQGYGYAWIVPHQSVNDFIEACLHLATPIIAFQIDGPKWLGSENAKLLRRFARIENILGKICLQDAISYINKFGPVEFLGVEVDKNHPQSLHRLHILYKNELSLTNLQNFWDHSIKGILVEVRLFRGKQKFPFKLAHNSRTTILRGDRHLGFAALELQTQEFQEQIKPSSRKSAKLLRERPGKDVLHHWDANIRLVDSQKILSTLQLNFSAKYTVSNDENPNSRTGELKPQLRGESYELIQPISIELEKRKPITKSIREHYIKTIKDRHIKDNLRFIVLVKRC